MNKLSLEEYFNTGLHSDHDIELVDAYGKIVDLREFYRLEKEFRKFQLEVEKLQNG